MNKETIVAKRTFVTETEEATKPKIKPTRTAEYPQIKEAVSRAVREYGEALRKLAKDD